MTSRGRTRSSRQRHHDHRRRARAVLAGIVAALVVGIVGCGEKDPTPQQMRQDAREQLEEGGATSAQATCITKRISDDLLETLSTGGTVDRTSKDFQSYTDAVVVCSGSK